MLEWRLKAYAAWLQMEEPHWARVEHPPIDYQDLHYYAAPKKKPGPKSLDEVDPELLRTYEKLGIPLKERAILAGVDPATDRGRLPGRGGRGVRQRLGRDHVPRDAEEGRRDLLPDQRGGARLSGTGAAISRLRRAGRRQFLRRAELGGVHRRQLRLRAEGRALPDGAVHLFPHQCAQHRPVRAHADHRRGRRLCQLPGRLHRADARREPVACRGGRTGRAGRRADQILHGAELVSGRCGRPRRHLQLRHQARRLPRRAQQDLLDPGGDRLGDHLEVSVLRAAGRRQRGRVLLGGGDQQLPAGRYRHQDDPYRQADQEHDRLQGHQRRALEQHLSRPGARAAAGVRRAQLHAVRLAC